MKFLLDQLSLERTEDDGTEVYTDEAGRLTVQVDVRRQRAVVRSESLEASLTLDEQGHWVPDDWQLLARVLGAPGLAAAALGF